MPLIRRLRLVRGIPLLVVFIVIGCSSAPMPPSMGASQPSRPSLTAEPATLAPTAAPPTAGVEATPSVFTSPVYGYSVVLPVGWSAVAATLRWDGTSRTSSDTPNVDQFYPTGLASSWASAAAYQGTLKEYTAKEIADTANYHGTTCPAGPEAQLPITVGGQPGILLQFNCGILINIAVTVDAGIGYVFGFRDPTVEGSSDSQDKAIFVGLLASTRFPG